MLGLFQRFHRPDPVRLSAYLDGRLGAAVAARTEAHVASCDACRARMAELQAARRALRSMPEAEAPRSFRLRPSDVQEPVRALPAPPMIRAMPVLGAAAVVVFAAVLGVDLSRSGGTARNDTALKASQRMAAGPQAAASSAAANDAASAATSISGPTPPAAAAGSELGLGGAAPADATASNRSTTSTNVESGAEAPAPGAASNPPEPQVPGAMPPTTLPADGQLAAAPATPEFQAAADRTATGSSQSGADTAYHIAEALAAAVALVALGTVIAWRVRRREV